jgi:AcrR family transcriptional regulator
VNADPDTVVERTAPLTERGRRTREKLLAAARSLFEDRGYAATRMSDVSIVAGVSHGTAYTWFTDKEAVLRGLVDTIVTDAYRALAVGDEISDPMARMAEANRRYLEAYRRDGRMLEVVEEVAGTDPRYREVLSGIRRDHVARVTREIEKLQSTGVAAADVNPAIAASALCAMVEGFGRHWYGRGEQDSASYDDATAVATLSTLWARGLGLTIDSGEPTDTVRTDAGEQS